MLEVFTDTFPSQRAQEVLYDSAMALRLIDVQLDELCDKLHADLYTEIDDSAYTASWHYIADMPLLPLTSLPDASRVWVFGAESPLDSAAEHTLLAAVDRYLGQWKAHGMPLTTGRDWKEHRFLVIAVDTSYEHASGCSIDGLFRELKQLSEQFGTSLVGSGKIYYRDQAGTIHCIDRADWTDLAQRGVVTRETVVFDLTVPTLGDWRTHFETTAEHSWHGTLLPQTVA